MTRFTECRMDEARRICALIERLGAGGRYRGFRCLACAVELALEDEDRLYGLTKALYPAVARRLHTKPGNVERNIRTLIARIWEKGDRAELCRLARRELTERPSVGEMIEILTSYLLYGIESQKIKKMQNHS